MNLIAKALVYSLLLLGAGFVGAAQERDGRYYEREAVKAYRQKDYAQYLAHLQRALELRPNHPRLLYNLAGAYSLNGQINEALQSLERVAAMGLIYLFEADEDLAMLRQTEAYQRISRQFARNKAPLIRSQPALTVPQKGLIGESVAYDPRDKVYYIASVRERKIIKIGKDGAARDFATEKDGLWSVLGLKIDAKRRHLWACVTATPKMARPSAADKGSTGLFKFDLQTGNFLQKYVLPDRRQEHWFGDLTIARNGDVYATDSAKPAIYVLRAGGETIEEFLADPYFVNLQGLAFAPDEQTLYVADYASGIFAVDLKAKRVNLLPAPADTTLLGVDGLYFHRNGLIATQNGVNPQRVLRLAFDATRARVVRVEILEANHPAHDEITLGQVLGNDFYYIANAQWWSFNDEGAAVTPEKLKDLIVLRLKLN
jgi:sugar lactone lactonase YvrE